MTVEELTSKLESAEKQIIGLQDEIQNLKVKLDEAREIPDFPRFKIGDDCYYLHSGLYVSKFQKTFMDTSRTIDDFNTFHTPEYAKFFADKCREIAMLLHCKWHIDRDFEPNWDYDNDGKFSVMWHHDPDDKSKAEYAVDNHYYSEYPTVYFSSREAAQKAADWMNER